MAITFSRFFALGIVLVTVLRTQFDLEALLFGDILRITQTDVWQIAMYVSYYFDVPSGPAIALTVLAWFLAALLFSPSQGILMRYFPAWRKRSSEMK